LKDKGPFCQLFLSPFLGFILFFSGCAHLEEMQEVEKIPVVIGIANWFNTADRFTFKDEMQDTLVHPFFDLVPISSVSDNSVNYFTVTQEDSEFAYDFDLVSGRRFKKFAYCNQNDVWRNFKSLIDRPPFTIGIVPRFLDQSNRPQKIIIFGTQENKIEENDNAIVSQRARVVGGVIEQYCEHYPCSQFNTWLSRLVLVAVDPNSSKFNDIKTFSSLRSKVDWEYAKAFLQNGDGRAIYTENHKDDKPAYRIVNQIEARQALEYSRNKGHFYDFAQLQSLRLGCEKVYDYTWEQLDSFILDKKDRKFKKFVYFFEDFEKNYLAQYRLCYKNVRASNINQSPERHWSLAMFELFFRLEEYGYEFSCQKGAWYESGSKKKQSRSDCKSEKLLLGFDVSTNILGSLSKGDRPYARYIEYDFGIGGTKEKIYSWVNVNNKKNRCSIWGKKVDIEPAFPVDVVWPLNKYRDKLLREKIIE
jgi:hypothetical protein